MKQYYIMLIQFSVAKFEYNFANNSDFNRVLLLLSIFNKFLSRYKDR